MEFKVAGAAASRSKIVGEIVRKWDATWQGDGAVCVRKLPVGSVAVKKASRSGARMRQSR